MNSKKLGVGISLETKQRIYVWIENSITSTDGRNGCNEVNISKRQYFQKYGNLSSELVETTEKCNKRGRLMVSVGRKVATCTISTIQDKLSKEQINVSVGTTLSLRPFFISFATEKEMALCLCKICLNAKLLFEPLIMQAKKDQYDVTEFISEFFMYNCNCPKSENGYYKWK